MCAILKEVTAVDESQFHANYDTFPEPLLFQTAEGGWLSNPAADDLCLSQVDYDNLAKWDENSSIWLAGRFFYVHGHRTSEGLFLLLSTDAFLSSASLNLSSQLRQRLSLAFNGMTDLKGHLSGDLDAAKDDFAVVSLALHQIFRMVTELERCSGSELLCNKKLINLTDWLRCLEDELRQLYATSEGVTLCVNLPDSPMQAFADSELLNCMVSHLVSNAVKAAPKGQVDVSITLKRDGTQAVLTVSGNSANFSSDFLTNPLWNQPNRLLVGRGLGLGLPLAQRIAALHGGTLMAPNTTGDNSQVAVSLPLTISENLIKTPTQPPIDQGGYSIIRVTVSDTLPPAAFHPDREPKE